MSESALAIVRLLLESGELAVEDLRDLIDNVDPSEAPTHRDFYPAVRAACPPASLSTYKTGFDRVVGAFGDRPLDDVAPSEIQALGNDVRSEVRATHGTPGVGAVRNLLHAARFFYRIAVDDGLLRSNPAASVPMPRASAVQERRALTSDEMDQIWQVARSGGNDPVLDVLLLDFHRETAARRGGALALTLGDCDRSARAVVLTEKGDRTRRIPVSEELLDRLLDLADDRGARSAKDAVLRYANGNPLTRRRYNSLWQRIQRNLPWASDLGVSMHWLRHTTLTDVSNASGPRIAAAYAGHVASAMTDRYTKPSFEDLRTAHQRLFGSH